MFESWIPYAWLVPFFPLLGAAIADTNPVLFFEQKSLYTKVKGRFEYDPSAPLAGARVRRAGCQRGIGCRSRDPSDPLQLPYSRGRRPFGAASTVAGARQICATDGPEGAGSCAAAGVSGSTAIRSAASAHEQSYLII